MNPRTRGKEPITQWNAIQSFGITFYILRYALILSIFTFPALMVLLIHWKRPTAWSLSDIALILFLSLLSACQHVWDIRKAARSSASLTPTS